MELLAGILSRRGHARGAAELGLPSGQLGLCFYAGFVAVHVLVKSHLAQGGQGDAALLPLPVQPLGGGLGRPEGH
jgi:hypothetical protein